MAVWQCDLYSDLPLQQDFVQGLLYLCLYLYVSLWFSEPERNHTYGSDLPREFLVFAFELICQ